MWSLNSYTPAAGYKYFNPLFIKTAFLLKYSYYLLHLMSVYGAVVVKLVCKGQNSEC